jgi:hypothetical protein
MVPGGTYNVALVIDGKIIESKPMKVVMDPALQMSDVQQKKYFDLLMDLHDTQRRGEEAASAMTPFYGQMQEIATKLPDMKDVPASVKTQFDTLKKDFDAVRVKFGVPPPAGGGGGRGGGGGAAAAGGAAGAAGGGLGAGRGGGRGGAAGATGAVQPAGAGAAAAAAPETPVDPLAQAGGGGGGFGGGGAAVARENLVGRAGAAKQQISSFTEMPSDTLMKEYNDVKLGFPKAIAEINAVYTKATAMVATLKKYDLTLNVPVPAK